MAIGNSGRLENDSLGGQQGYFSAQPQNDYRFLSFPGIRPLKNKYNFLQLTNKKLMKKHYSCKVSFPNQSIGIYNRIFNTKIPILPQKRFPSNSKNSMNYCKK
jgi:hypothetical protein